MNWTGLWRQSSERLFYVHDCISDPIFVPQLQCIVYLIFVFKERYLSIRRDASLAPRHPLPAQPGQPVVTLALIFEGRRLGVRLLVKGEFAPQKARKHLSHWVR